MMKNNVKTKIFLFFDYLKEEMKDELIMLEFYTKRIIMKGKNKIKFLSLFLENMNFSYQLINYYFFFGIKKNLMELKLG